MTGAYIRVYRGNTCLDGKWYSVEFDQLTDDEMDTFSNSQPNDGWKWAKFFAKWIRDNITGKEK